MATYKIPRDVEAEDKLVGPFTFKQFVFLIVAVIAAYLTWVFFQITPFLSLLTLPIVLLFGFIGVYHREDQPIETYIAALLNFVLKSRQRVWQHNAVSEAVRLVKPKLQQKPVQPRDPKKVKGQLQRLAQVIDTRGWSSKNPLLQEPFQPESITHEDRIVFPNQAAQSAEPVDVRPGDDILDITNNPYAKGLTQRVTAAGAQAKQQAIAKMQSAIKKPGASAPAEPQPEPVQYQPYPDIQQHTLDPRSGSLEKPVQPDDTSSNKTVTPDILQLSQSDELTVSQIASQAERHHKQQMAAGEEVSIRNESQPANTNQPTNTQSANRPAR